MNQIWRVTAGLVISAGCLLFAFRSVPVPSLLKAVTSIPFAIVMAWIALAGFSLLLRSMRWQLLLGRTGHLPFLRVLAVNSAGQMGNAILPARLGDLFRATNLGSLSSGFALATILVERVLDTGFLVSVAAVALTSFRDLPAWLTRGAGFFGAAAVVGVALALLMPSLEDHVVNLMDRIVPARYRVKLSHLTRQFIGGLGSLRNPGKVFAFLLFTVVIWSSDAAGAVILARGLSVTLTPAIAALLLTAVALSSALPAAPGNIGVYQMVAVSVLVPFGVARPQALGLAILLQALILANLLIWGLASLWFLAGKGLNLRGVPVRAQLSRVQT